MIVFNSKKLHTDIIVRLASIKKPQHYLAKKLGVSRAIIWRIDKGRPIEIKSLLTLTNWLGNDPSIYFKEEKHKNYRTNQLK